MVTPLGLLIDNTRPRLSRLYVEAYTGLLCSNTRFGDRCVFDRLTYLVNEICIVMNIEPNPPHQNHDPESI